MVRLSMRQTGMSEPETQAADAYPQSGGASDARLIEDFRRGDTSGFEQLVRRYEGRLMSVLLRFVRDRELARDLSQETFLRVYERIGQFDPSRRFGPWLFRIGVNLTLDYLRKRKRRVWPALFTDNRSERAPDPAVADPRGALDLEQEVRRVLEQIPEKYRTVLILRDLENFSSSEIAAIMNRKEATIRWRLAEARLRFEQLWTRRQIEKPAGLLVAADGDSHEQSRVTERDEDDEE
jgi:RNA polymerase sigma-70 factor, ECF subfamily